MQHIRESRRPPDDVSRAEQGRTTVVVITHNRCAELDRTLTELGRHDPPPPIIVVANACTDDTASVVARHMAVLPGLRHLELHRNEGAVARNHGVDRAHTPYVAFCDDDSWWEPGALDAAADILDANPDLGGVIGRTLVNDEGRPDPINAVLRESPLDTDARSPGPRVMGFLACAAVVRSEAFREAGGFSPVLGFVGEEELLAMDLAACGWDLAYVDSIVVHHHPSTRRSPHDRRRGRELVNALLTAVLRRPPSRIARSAAALVTAVVRRGIGVRALSRVFTEMPRAVRSRRRLPESVEDDLARVERAVL